MKNHGYVCIFGLPQQAVSLRNLDWLDILYILDAVWYFHSSLTSLPLVMRILLLVFVSFSLLL